jgi:hypothetical protein
MSEAVMTKTHPPRRIGRSIGAVLAGIFAGLILTIGTDVVLRVIGVFPTWGTSMVGFAGALVLATVYRGVYGVAASYLIARLAPDRPMQHALVGGFMGFVVSIVGAALTVEQRTGFRASLVSARPHSTRNTASLGGWQTLRNAIALTLGAIKSLLLPRLLVRKTGDTYGPHER